MDLTNPEEINRELEELRQSFKRRAENVEKAIKLNGGPIVTNANGSKWVINGNEQDSVALVKKAKKEKRQQALKKFFKFIP